MGWWLLVACAGGAGGEDSSGKGGDTGGGGDPSVEVTITSPGEGDTFDFGQAIDLSVEATRDGEPVEIKRAVWTIGDWTGDGASTTAEGLDAGDHKVQVVATIGGDDYRDSVDITVLDAPPLNYRGQVNIDLHLDHPDYGEYDDGCDGAFDFVLDGNAFTGSGTCTEELFGEQFPFSIEGTARGGDIEGELILQVDADSYTTPFTGTGGYGDAMHGDFDYTHRADGASLRVYGTWDANPQ